MNKMCKFCDYYKEIKQMYKKFEANPEFSDLKHKHKLKLVTYTYVKSKDYRKSDAHPSSVLSKDFEIKYCPVCGRKLTREVNMKKDEHVLKRFTTTVLTCDKPTITGRVYPKTLVEEAVIEDSFIKEKIANRMFFCEFPSNDEEPYAYANLNNVAFSVENLSFEDDDLKADIAVLDTTQGKILNKLIDSDASVIFSCSGVGSIDINNKVTDYKLLSIRADIADNEQGDN